MPEFKNVHIIINPASGKPEPILHTLNRVFHEHDDVEWHVAVTRENDSGQQLARQAVESGADLVMVYGGDGTVRDVAGGLSESDVPLAILHGGTGNAMAYQLGIPAELEQATRLVMNDHNLQTLDMGKVVREATPDEAGFFLLRASIGLQPQIMETASRELKNQFGNFAYVIASIQSLAGSKNITYELEIDGDAVQGKGLTCMIANSAAVGGYQSMVFAPEVDPGDGQLDAFILNASFQSIVSMVNSAIDGNPELFPHRWQGKEIKIKGDPHTLTLDGEVYGKTPATITILPAVTQVVVPTKN